MLRAFVFSKKTLSTPQHLWHVAEGNVFGGVGSVAGPRPALHLSGCVDDSSNTAGLLHGQNLRAHPTIRRLTQTPPPLIHSSDVDPAW